MARRFMRRGRSGRSSRKTRWQYAFWQGGVTADSDLVGGVYNYFTFWLKWPADRVTVVDAVGTPGIAPSDETVVRQLCRLNVTLDPTTAGFRSPLNVVFGAIGFDGGADPTPYDLATFSGGTAFRPPHPILDAHDDWMMRIPMNFLYASNQVPSLEDVFVQSKAKRKMPPGTGVLGVIGVGNVLEDDLQSTFYWSIDWRAAVRSGYTR